jgi:hypothetical protein
MSGKRGCGRPRIMSAWQISYARRAQKLHQQTTGKVVAARLGVKLRTMRRELYGQ